MKRKKKLSGWAGWALAHSEYGNSVNPIPTRRADYTKYITTCPPGFENLTPSLELVSTVLLYPLLGYLYYRNSKFGATLTVLTVQQKLLPI